MIFFKLRHVPIPVPVNGTVAINNDEIGGFNCVTSGTITITASNDVAGQPATPVLTGFPVTAGTWTFIPYILSVNGGTITAAGGASGTLAA